MSSTVSEFEKIQIDRELYSDFIYPYLIAILEYRGIRFTRIEEMDKIGKWKSEHVQKLEDEEELHGTRVTFSVFARHQGCEIVALFELAPESSSLFAYLRLIFRMFFSVKFRNAS